MSAHYKVEILQRIEFLRAKLDQSLKIAADSLDSVKRPVHVIFQSADTAHIQISGPVTDEASLKPICSRFTVSPTPNAIPVMIDSGKGFKHLRLLITKEGDGGAEAQPKTIPTQTVFSSPPLLFSSSSPASSIDSGVASPGSCDFLFWPSPSPPIPSWTTVPRSKGRLFSFGGASSLVDALALSGKSGTAETRVAAEFTLQGHPPAEEKKPWQNGSTSEQHSQSDNNSNGSSKTTSKTTAALMPLQRQLSEGSAPMVYEENILTDGLPPRAATMPPLKSILKKSRTDHGAYQMDPALPRNHQRRMPTRFVLSRSISEDSGSCIEGKIAAFETTNEKLCTNSQSPSASGEPTGREVIEEVEEPPEYRGIRSPSSFSTETIDSEEFTPPVPMTKKRVSFSEHVQARIYRSNSSILGQRRKNEKKARQRVNRRCNSDTDGADDGEQQKSSTPCCRPQELPHAFANRQTPNSVFAQ